MATVLSRSDISNHPSGHESVTEAALERIDSEHGVEYARNKFARTLRGDRPGLKVGTTFCPDDGESPFSTVTWEHRSASIKDDSGKALFEQTDCEVPSNWTQLATNVVVSKYFYGDPKRPNERERSVRQLIHRVTRTIADWGLKDGYFDTPEDGDRFYRELTWLCLHQHGAFNSPVWFNVGLHAQYGVAGSKCNWRWDPEAETTEQPENPYEYPQGSACFIQSVDDNMEDIMRLACSEAMLFKFGSGTGTDLSTIRSQREKLSGGGTPPARCRSCGSTTRSPAWSRVAARPVARRRCSRSRSGTRTSRVHREQMVRRAEGASSDPQGYESNFNGEAYAASVSRTRICRFASPTIT